MATQISGSRTTQGLAVRLLRRCEPLRRLPAWARYLITAGFVLVCFTARYAMDGFYPYPYLIFLPAIVAASFAFDRGSGFFATFLSAVLAVQFFIEPYGSFALPDPGAAISGVLFVTIGLLIAMIVEALRTAVEELVTVNKSLGRSLNILETVIESIPDPVFVKDTDCRFLRVNATFARLVGAPASALTGHTDSNFVVRKQAERTARCEQEVMTHRRPLVVEEEIHVAGEGPRWYLSTRAPWYGPDGSLAGVIGIARDIHERKRAEEAVRAASAQKDILLRDINHRVKNHLQSVIATLSMSRRRVADPEAREAIQATATRLAVLARVYDRLQLKPGGDAVVDAKDFVEGLCADLKPGLIDQRPIRLVPEIESVSLELGRAVALGLIVNEALTNALKHAFPGDAGGTVRVIFGRLGTDCRLDVHDDGVGRPPAGEWKEGNGRRLIQALAKQLGGSASWGGPPGTVVTISFPIEPGDAAS